MPECRHYWVSGRVQGVFFRASTQQAASRFNVTGWVRNLHDGRVEVYACGSSADLDKIEAWLVVGPEMAEVESVRTEKCDYIQYDDFQIV